MFLKSLKFVVCVCKDPVCVWQPERWARVRGPDIELPPLCGLVWGMKREREKEEEGRGNRKMEWRRGE